MLIQEEVRRFFWHAAERERIRIKKEAGEPKPWTQDPVFQKFKFTNTLRSDDAVSRWLITNWYRPHENYSFELQILHCAIARWFGTWEFCEALGWQDDWNPDRIIQKAEERLAKKQRVFTGAYVITNGGISGPKQEIVVREYLTPFWNAVPKLLKVAEETRRWELVFNELQKVPGHAGQGFMAKEILSDAIYTPVLRDVIDRNTWSPACPGARRGLNRLHGRPVDQPLSFPQALEEMKELFALAPEYWESHMPTLGGSFDLHGIQFLACEFDKRRRVELGEGRPRSTYAGVK